MVFDAAAGTTSLQSLQSERPVALSGGNLQIAGLLKTTDYNQSGGALSGSGTLDVNGSFTQSAGSIALGAIDITQASGNLTFTNLGAPVVKLSAPTGAISHSGALAVASLATTASAGITLSNSANKIGALSASNTGTGDILIVNSIPFSLLALANRAGNIDITNLGAITTSGPVVASVGNIFLTANSPLTIGAGGVAAGGDIVLTASNLTSAGDMTLNGPITSGGKVILDAGNNLQQNSTVLGALGVTARAGGRANFGPFATSNNSPISYSAGGASIDPPPTRLGASEVIVQETAKQVDVIVTFLDQFQKAVDQQRAGGDETNPDGSKKKDLEAIVTEGEVCK